MRYSGGDYYEIADPSLTRGHWAAGAAVNDCRESGVMIMAPCGTQFAGEVLGAELELTWPLITSCCFDPAPCAVYVCVLSVPQKARG